MPAWLRTVLAAAVGFVVLAATSFILDAIFSFDPRMTLSVMLIGSLLLVWLYKDQLGLPALSDQYLHKGIQAPVISFLVVALVGGLLGAILFGGSWLWMLYDYKKNPPALPRSRVLVSEQQRTPTMLEQLPLPSSEKSDEPKLADRVRIEVDGEVIMADRAAERTLPDIYNSVVFSWHPIESGNDGLTAIEVTIRTNRLLKSPVWFRVETNTQPERGFPNLLTAYTSGEQKVRDGAFDFGFWSPDIDPSMEVIVKLWGKAPMQPTRVLFKEGKR